MDSSWACVISEIWRKIKVKNTGMVNLGSFFLQGSARVRRSTPKKVHGKNDRLVIILWIFHTRGYGISWLVWLLYTWRVWIRNTVTVFFRFLSKLEKALPLVYLINYDCLKVLKSYHSLHTDYKFSIIILNIPFWNRGKQRSDQSYRSRKLA